MYVTLEGEIRGVGGQSSNVSSENEPLRRFPTNSTTSFDSNMRAVSPISETHSQQTLLQVPSVQRTEEPRDVTPSSSVVGLIMCMLASIHCIAANFHAHNMYSVFTPRACAAGVK